MTVHIQINGENAAEALAELRGLSAGLLGTTSLTPPAPAALSPTETSDMSQDEAPKETVKPRGGRPKKETAKPSEVPADAKAQDAADEQAETEAQRAAQDAEVSALEERVKTLEAAPPVTKDDLRAVIGDYAKAYGMDAAMTDCPGIMGFPNISSVPDTQDAIRAAVISIREAVTANPQGRAKA